MKIKFTEEEMDAIEVAYCDNEGYLPCNVNHTPEQKEYQILQQLWLKMAEKVGERKAKEIWKWDEDKPRVLDERDIPPINYRGGPSNDR